MKNLIKNQIKKYLKKHLGTHPKHYYFLRWLADIVKDSNQLNDVCAGVARWMYDTNESNLLGHLNDLFVVDDNVYIYTFRPGLWIGKHGSICESLEHSLNHNVNDEKIHNYKIRFIEIHKKPYSEIMGYAHFYANNW